MTQRSTEYYGQGQSGYTAGRIEHDKALEQQLEPRNLRPLKEDDEHLLEVGADERFTGVGGVAWPEEDDEQESKPE